MIDWDAYRSGYDSMSYADQVAFYDKVWRLHPEQRHYSPDACSKFLSVVEPDRVLEVGGWRGELAAEMLPLFPKIMHWHNIEICRGAVENSVCSDPHYSTQVPSEWMWELPHEPGGVLVAAHVIEHMTKEQVLSLLWSTRPRAAFVQSPLTEKGQDWAGYNGSHVLKSGWEEVIDFFGWYGLKHDPSMDAPDVRCFR